MTILNWDHIKYAPVSLDPYPHFIVDQAICLDAEKEVSDSFPPMRFAGLVPLKHVTNNGGFHQLMADLESTALRSILPLDYFVSFLGHD
mgnify:CR=1 FL=1